MNTQELLQRMDELAATDVAVRSVKIKGLGDVNVRALSISEVDANIADREADKKKSVEEGDDAKHLGLARGACRLLCDERGVRLLDPHNEDHVRKMAALPFYVLRAIDKAVDDDEEGAEKK